MGIIVRDLETEQIVFYLKGADMVMKPIVQYNDWLEEEVGCLVFNHLAWCNAWFLALIICMMYSVAWLYLPYPFPWMRGFFCTLSGYKESFKVEQVLVKNKTALKSNFVLNVLKLT